MEDDKKHSESGELRLTLPALVAEVSARLSEQGVEVLSQRVSDAPNLRTVRYYAQHGLLSRPVAWRGRTALYGREHIVQLVAIKRLQSLGLTLSEVQERLMGLSAAELEAIADLDADTAPPSAPAPPARDAAASSWRTPPVDIDCDAPTHNDEDEEEDDHEEADHSARQPNAIAGVEVTPELTLLLRGGARAPHSEDLEAIEAACAPLLRLLRARSLI